MAGWRWGGWRWWRGCTVVVAAKEVVTRWWRWGDGDDRGGDDGVVVMKCGGRMVAGVGRRGAEKGECIENIIRFGSRLDTAYPSVGYRRYWGFLGVGTTLDIFQNIILIPYLEYGLLILSGYGVLIFIPLWSLVSTGTDTSYLP
ncbi:hypothetical protein Tco_0828283 [Tanacetum coccineum]